MWLEHLLSSENAPSYRGEATRAFPRPVALSLTFPPIRGGGGREAPLSARQAESLREIFDILAKETNRSNEDTVREQKAGCGKLESNVSFYNFETRDEKVK